MKANLIVQKESLNRTTFLYERLREQLKEVASILSHREKELQAKDKEMDTLKTEISSLKLKFSNLERSFQQYREKQEVIKEELFKVKNLNRILRERLTGAPDFLSDQVLPQSLEEEIIIEKPALGEKKKETSASYLEQEYEEKKKVDELRKRVEVILRPSSKE